MDDEQKDIDQTNEKPIDTPNNADYQNDVNDENINQLDNENNDSEENTDEFDYMPDQIQSGRDAFANTIGDHDYYKNRSNELSAQAEELKNNQEKLKEERNNNTKTNEDGTETAKNVLDKAGDIGNQIGNKAAQVSNAISQGANKINQAKAAAYAVSNPYEAAKMVAQQAISKPINELLKKLITNPYFWLVVACIFLLLILTIALIGASDGNATETYVDSEYDFNSISVVVTYNGQTLQSQEISDLYKNILHYYYNENTISNLGESEVSALYSSGFVALRSYILSSINYKNSTKKYELNLDSLGLGYCSTSGCENIPSLSSENKEILNSSYVDTKYILLLNDNLESVLTSVNSSAIFNEDISSLILKGVNAENSYTNVLLSISNFKNLYFYDLTQYAKTYISFASGSLWWPIGSSTADESGLYSGTPVTTRINSPFGTSSDYGGGGTFHNGIDIPASSNTPVISVSYGEVIEVNDGCPSLSLGYYDSSYGYYRYDTSNPNSGGYGCTSGNYVWIKSNNIVFKYLHLYTNSVTVKVGDQVSKGQLIGGLGSSGVSTGPHLHFGVWEGSNSIDPLQYVDPYNPRP